MAIKYTIEPCTGALKSKTGYCLRTRKNRSVDDADLTEQLHRQSTLTAHDFAAALSGLRQWVKGELKKGNHVTLRGIGTLYPSVDGTVETDQKGSLRARHVHVRTIHFLPDRQLLAAMEGAQFQHDRSAATARTCPSDEAIEAAIDQLLAERPFFMPQDFFAILGLASTTGYALLAKWEQAGRLRNIGRRHRKLYSR